MPADIIQTDVKLGRMNQMKLHLLVTIAVLFLSLCLTLEMIAQADVVEILDSNLRAAILKNWVKKTPMIPLPTLS